jgi:hypothetical protein
MFGSNEFQFFLMRPETFVHVIYGRKKTKFTQKRSSLNIAEGDQ